MDVKRLSIAIFLLTLITGQLNVPCFADDFFDSLSQIAPDPAEAPKVYSLNLPDQIDDVRLETDDPPSQLNHWVRWAVLKNIPTHFEDNKKWGLQKDVYNGFRFRNEGLKIETYRVYRTVKHGTWSRYYLDLIDPNENLKVEIQNMQPISDDRFTFDAVIEAPFHVFGRIARWQRDVQLISISTNADAAVRLSLNAQVGVKLNPLLFPPEIQFEPKVQSAKLELTQFEVYRISQIGGDVAEELGKGMRHFVDDRLKDYSDKLVIKINTQLEKQKDKLKISTQDSMRSFQWTKKSE